MPDSLKTLSLDIETGKLLINGENLENVTYFQLTFDSGEWDLSISQRNFYGIAGRKWVKDWEKNLEESKRDLEELKKNYAITRNRSRQLKRLSVAALVLSVIALVIRVMLVLQ